MFEKFTARSPKARKAPVSPLEMPTAAPKRANTTAPAKSAEGVKPGGEKATKTADTKSPPPKEIGGPSGPEPTRYGDWERKGICVDF